jgi:hypothetical protein
VDAIVDWAARGVINAKRGVEACVSPPVDRLFPDSDW